MNFTFNQLRIFLAVVEQGSITRAAEKLHLTQPAVSLQLKKLQQQFDYPLTVLEGRRVSITSFGHEVADTAQGILRSAQDLESMSQSYGDVLTGTLHLSIVSTGKYVMPYFLQAFMKQHPGLKLTVDVTNKEQVVDSINRKEVDFSLVSILPQDVDYESVELLSNELFLIGNREREFPKSKYGLGIFKELPLIYREEGSGTRRTMESYIAANNLPVILKMTLTSNEAVKQAVNAGLGYSIMPLIGLRDELANEMLQIIPVKGLPVRSTWNLIWPRNRALSPAAAAYLAFVREHRKAIIERHFSWRRQYSDVI